MSYESGQCNVAGIIIIQSVFVPLHPFFFCLEYNQQRCLEKVSPLLPLHAAQHTATTTASIVDSDRGLLALRCVIKKFNRPNYKAGRERSCSAYLVGAQHISYGYSREDSPDRYQIQHISMFLVNTLEESTTTEFGDDQSLVKMMPQD